MSYKNRLANIASHFLYSRAKKINYKFKYASHMIPHPEKAHKGGEDALFASDNILVVADGVGGWADYGVDPGKYSKKLCEIIGKKVSANSTKYVDDPQKLVIEAWKQNKEIGSTTVCMLTLNPESGKLKAYYIGDSIYGLFSQQLARIAEEQQKSFNFPYQIGSEGDNPSDGVLHELPIEDVEKQTIVLGTDGLWDNYSIENIQKCLGPTLEESVKAIAENCYRQSLQQKNYKSPFHLKALQSNLRYPQSGKPDDITVIVATIIKEEL